MSGNGNGNVEMAEIRALMLECVKQNISQGQRMDSLGQRLDETNSRIDRKVDSFIQTVSTWREEMRQQQSQLLAIHSEVMAKLERLPEDVRIGFGNPGKHPE